MLRTALVRTATWRADAARSIPWGAPRGSPVMLMAGLDHVSCLMPAILWSPKVAEPVLQLTRVQLYPRKRSMIDPTRHAAIMHIGHRTCHVASDRLQ